MGKQNYKLFLVFCLLVLNIIGARGSLFCLSMLPYPLNGQIILTPFRLFLLLFTQWFNFCTFYILP